MSIKAKQVAGVTSLVVAIVAILSAYHLATLARLSLEETQLRGDMLARAVFQRAREVVPAPGSDLSAALREDGGVRSILESGVGYGPSVTYAAIVDASGIAIVHAFRSREGQVVPEQPELRPVIAAGAIEQLRAVYSDRTFEIRQPMLADDQHFGSIRIGVSTLLIRSEFGRALRTAAGGVLVALILASLVAMLLAQWMLRPIHVIQSGLTRLGRGELDVSLDLPGEEFRDLGSSFEAVSAQLAAVRTRPVASPSTDLESVMENLEDAVALVSPAGEVIFTNAAMKALRDEHGDHPAMKQLIEQTLAGRKSLGPVSITGTKAPGLPEDTHAPRTPARDACHLRHRGPLSGRHARGAQSRLPQSSAVDAQLLAEARRPQPADGRRGARGQEPAQRDDDSPGVAEAEAGPTRCDEARGRDHARNLPA